MALILKRLYTGYNWILSLTDPRAEDLFLIGSPMQLIMFIAAYIFLVKYLLPKYMKNREPYNLRSVLIIYNLFQITMNSYFVYKLLSRLLQYTSWTCAEVDYSLNTGALDDLRLGYHVFLLKMFDLLDTVFFILKKNWRQVTFLHVYHHSGVVVSFWIGITFAPGGHSIWLPLINCAVHVLMFAYYLLTVLDQKWKKSFLLKRTLTQIQLLQFMFFTFIYSLIFFVPGCKFPKILAYLTMGQNFFFIFMFGDFYVNTYVCKKQKEKFE